MPEVLALETMLFADEVRDPQDVIENLPAGGSFRGRELTIAKQLIGSMATGWNPRDYRDSYRERVADLIERKQRGEEIVTQGAPAEDSNVVDLMDALRRSAEQARGRRPSGARSKGKAASGAKGKLRRKAG